jgi:O-antigen/teichoic acid export membrane protein
MSPSLEHPRARDPGAGNESYAKTPRAGLARRLAVNTLHAATGRFASLLVWVVLTPPILRAIGTEGFAIWSLFSALTGYFGALDFGLAQGTLKQVAAARARGEAGSGGAFATLAALGYLALAALWLILALLFRGALLDWLQIPVAARAVTGVVMLAGAGVFACSGLANVTMAALQGCGRFDLANLVLLAAVAQQAIGIPVVLHARWGLAGLVANVGIGWGLGLGLGLWQLARAELDFRWGSPARSMAHTVEAFRFGGPIQLTNMLTVMHSQLDKFLLARFVQLAAVTPYELGYRVILGVYAPPQLLVLALLPAAAALHAAENHGRLRELYLRANRYVLAAAAVTLAASLGSAGRIYWMWLGPGHAEAALALRGLSLSSAVWITTLVGTTVARGIGRTDLEAWFSVVALAAHLPLSLLLLPRYGLSGALVATLAANLIAAAFFLARLSRTLGWPRAQVLFEPLGVPLLALALGAATSFELDRLLPPLRGVTGWLLLAGVAAAGGAIALATTLATRFIRWQEARDILSFSRREGDSR